MFNYTPYISVVGAAVLGVAGWVFKLGNRVTAVEVHEKDLVTLMGVRFDSIDSRLERIERNQDKD